MKKLIKLLFSFVFLFLFTVLSINPLSPSKVKANFDECPLGVFCFYKDVWSYPLSSWQNSSAVASPGDQESFSIGIQNTTGVTVNNVVISDTLPSGLSFVPGSLQIFGYSGSYTESDLFGAGINFGNLNNNKSIQFKYKVNVDPTLEPGSYTFTNTAQVNATGYSILNTASVNVNVTAYPDDSGLTGNYYNNKTLSCSPTFTQVDGVVDSTQIAWPLSGGPGGGLSDDDFAVSWEGQIKSDFSESITLKTSSDDGVRVFFNGNLVIDKWLDRSVPVTKDTASVAMTAGSWYNIRIDYYEHGGDSIAQLFWNGAAQTGGVDEIIPQQNLRQAYTETLNYGLTGNYFNSASPLGTPDETCIDQSSYYYFDLGSPRPGMNTDNFSVSWTGKVVTDFAESYTFCTIADDGTRLWIDDNIVIDDFVPHGLEEACGSIALAAGQHNSRVDYFDSTADSAVGIYWQGASQTAGAKVFIPIDHLIPTGYTGSNFGLTGNYYSNTGLLGIPTVTRIDPNVNFDFGPLSPDGSIPTDYYSIRWTGKVVITEAGAHNFVIYADDGIRFTLDGSLLIDQWIDQPKTRTETGAVVLAPGSYDIQIDYFENAGMSGVFFYYDTPSSPGEIVVPMSVLTH